LIKVWRRTLLSEVVAPDVVVVASGADVAVVVDVVSVQVDPAVPHRNRARSWEKATVLRKSSRARAYKVLRFIKSCFIGY
jgi:hypothetical protein